MAKPSVGYALYLVTDSTAALLRDRDLADVVERALAGGVTVVQYRDKHSDTGELVATARRLHAITKKFRVPLLINDRVDVALAVGCEGVHIGQDDLDLATARRLLGDHAIIGVTAGTVAEAIAACEGGADYLGIGTVFATATKTNTQHILGTAGTKAILEAISGYPARTVCIGGINSSNVAQVLQQTRGAKSLDGVAVVSAVVSATNPTQAARELSELIQKNLRSPPLMTEPPYLFAALPRQLADVRDLIRQTRAKNPLSHNMTNLVVQNIAANVALAVGASPIMANDGREAGDLSQLGGGLVINMGSVTDEGIRNFTLALQAYNAADQPVVLDPVGAAATSVRRLAVQQLLGAGQFAVIKGNEGEIKFVAGQAGAQQRGVDSGTSTLTEKERGVVVRDLAARRQCVVVMTGAVDVVSNGTMTVAVRNGHPYLGEITGSGCVLGTIISAYLAAHHHTYQPLVSVIAALLHYEIAAEVAAARPDVLGPGSFAVSLIDALYNISTVNESLVNFEHPARVEVVQLD